MVTSWLSPSALRRSNGKTLLLFPRLVSLPMMQGRTGRWGPQERVASPTVSPGTLISQMAPSLPLSSTGLAAPHHLHVAMVDGRVAACPELGQDGGCGTGMSLQMLQPGLAAAKRGLRGCSSTPKLHHKPVPPPGPGFSAGNETSSNYSSQARKSGRSHGPGLTQLRSAVSGRAARSPLLPLFICPAGSCEVTNFANNEPHRGVWGG